MSLVVICLILRLTSARDSPRGIRDLGAKGRLSPGGPLWPNIGDDQPRGVIMQESAERPTSKRG